MEEKIVQAISELISMLRKLNIDSASNWTEPSNIIAISSATFTFFSIFVSGYLGYITYKVTRNQKDISEKEMKISERQIKLSLYERRYSCYKRLSIKFEDIFNMKDFNKKTTAEEFSYMIENLKQEVIFLFEDDVNEYVKEVLKMCLAINIICMELYELNNSLGNENWSEIFDVVKTELPHLDITLTTVELCSLENADVQKKILNGFTRKALIMKRNLDHVFEPYLNFRDIK